MYLSLSALEVKIFFKGVKNEDGRNWLRIMSNVGLWAVRLPRK
jgi:hypothetical protein